MIYKTFLKEESQATLNIFDLDDTLFHTKAKVKVIKNNKVVRELEASEYNNDKLNPGESYDYGQFRSAEVFKKTATPIGRMVGKLKTVIRNITTEKSKVIIVTARKDFDNKQLFLNTLESYGIDINKLYIERAGNLELGSSAKNKRFIFHKYLRGGRFMKIRLFDDSVKNLNSFLALQKLYSDYKFEAWQVNKNGTVERFKHL